MPFFALAADTIGSAVVGGIASNVATNAQSHAAETAQGIQEANLASVTQQEQPFITAGTNALAALQSGLGIGGSNATGVGSLNAPFTAAQYQQSPGYQFQLQQGEQALLDQRSAIGGVSGGNTLKALTQYGQGLANTDYQQAYNNYVAQQQQQYNMLSGLSNQGLSATNALAGVSTGTANNVAGLQTQIGNAQAAGVAGTSNAVTGALNNLSTSYLLANALGGGSLGGGFTIPSGPVTPAAGFDATGLPFG